MANKHLKHKERMRKEAHERYQNLSEEEKDKRQKKLRDRYQNLPEEQKQKLLEYKNNIIYRIKSNYLVTLKILGKSGLFHGLVLEMLEEILNFFYEFKDFVTIISFFLIFFYCPRLLHFPLLNRYSQNVCGGIIIL